MFDESRHFGLMGGAGSGKSYACADKFIMRMVSEPGHRLIVFRKVARTIKRSVWALLLERLSHWNIRELCTLNRTDFTIAFVNGSEIWCVGLDDQEKLKSIQGMSGAWTEEATEFTAEDLNQINLRLRGSTPGYKQIQYSFNPISIKHHLKDRLFDNPPASSDALITTYRDNRYIDKEYERELIEMGRKSKNFESVYVLGQWGILEGLIYDAFLTGEYPTDPHDSFYCLDFGFNNAMALLRGDVADEGVYLTELVYESGLTTTALIRRMDEIKIDKGVIIYCDSAEPDRIQELCDAGYWAVGAYKGPGSVRAGIDYCQSVAIYSKADNVNLNAEAMSYAWRMDKDGKPMDEPTKINDHAMDAMRYGIYTHLGKPSAELFSFDRAELGV
jgi:phage terminase large subunit